ncbi:TonB-dependent receptor domain-containing protein [Luteimonas sp. RIT-PG2_3]
MASKSTLFKGIACALACSISLAAWAQDARTRQVSVPGGDLAGALDALRQQVGGQILYRADQMKGVRTRGVSGELSSEAALATLLEGTGWVLRKDPSGAMVVVKAQTNPPATTRPARPAPQTAVDDEAVSEIARVSVTGSRLARLDVEGPSPVITFDNERLQRSGVTDVADIFRYLPQQPFSTSSVGGEGGSAVQLRGLGHGNTLVLINGRRAITSGLFGSRGVVDLNTIPLTAVERIEVLPDSASAIYGADAIAGVVNVILKQGVERPSLEVRYGAAADGAEEKRIAGTVGIERGRVRGTLIFDYFDRGTLLGADRALTADADYRPFGGPDRRVNASNPGTVCSADGSNLPGLPAPCAAVPAGTSGIGLTPADFLATAAQQNLDSRRRFESTVTATERYGVSAFGEVDISERLQGFAEATYSHWRSENQLMASVVTNRLVPATNPFNPFDAPVRVNYRFDEVGPRAQKTGSESLRLVAGLKGGFGDAWDWEVSAAGSKDDGWQNSATNGVDSAKVDALLALTDPATALNLFGERANSPEIARALLEAPDRQRFIASADYAGVSGFMRGDLFSLPTGAVQSAWGSEWRSEEITGTFPGMGIDYLPGGASREVSAGFAELRFPLIAGDSSVDGTSTRLALTAAGRYDHYSDFGGTFNAKFGVEWNVSKSLLLRATYGDSFRAPTLWDLNSMPLSLSTVTNDIRRGNETTSIIATYGGNPDLQPEESDAFSAGFVYVPDVAGKLRIAANYWRIRQDLRTNQLNLDMILRNESLFPDRVIREAPTAADIAAGLPGRLTSVNFSAINFGALDTSGVDLEMSFSMDVGSGQLRPSLAATWIRNYRAADFPDAPLTERVGIADYRGTIPRWRVVTGLEWVSGPFGASLIGRYGSGYADTNYNIANGLEVPSQVIFDLQGSLDLDALWAGNSRWAQGATIRIGIANLFDREAPFSDVINNGYDPSIADIRQRFSYVQLVKGF